MMLKILIKEIDISTLIANSRSSPGHAHKFKQLSSRVTCYMHSFFPQHFNYAITCL